MNAENQGISVTAASKGVDGAGGVGALHWYVAIVNHNTEKKCAEKLSGAGYDTYVATQEEYRMWRNGRKAKIDRVVIPSIVFIRCTEKQRVRALSMPYIYRFMTNKASAPNQYGKSVAIIPDFQIQQLRFMLGHSDSPVGFADSHYAYGDKVRVIRGGLRGLEGEVITAPDGHSELIIRLDILGCASVRIDAIDVEKLP